MPQIFSMVNCFKLILFQHPRYGSGAGSFPNDIALLQFSAVETFSTVKAITITNSDQAGNRDCWITGWGRTQSLYTFFFLSHY